MNKEQYIEDLRDIREMMNKSGRFISLSGLSGIFAGVVALAAAYAAYHAIYENQNYLSYRKAVITNEAILAILVIAIVTIILAVGGAVFFTVRKAKKENEKVWNIHTKNLLLNLFVPLVAGGVVCLMLLSKGYVGVVAPLTLVFYGIGLFSASKYSHPELYSLGILEMILGLIAMYFIGYGLLFWTIGFGVLHIAYGIIMKNKYGS